MPIRSRFTFTFYNAPRNVGRGQVQPVKHVGRLMGRGPARPGPSISHMIDRCLAQPINFSQFSARSMQLSKIFSRPGPARPAPSANDKPWYIFISYNPKTVHIA